MNYEFAKYSDGGGVFSESNSEIINSVMRELRSRSKKLNGKHTEKNGAELPHNNAYFITLMMSYLGAKYSECGGVFSNNYVNVYAGAELADYFKESPIVLASPFEFSFACKEKS